MGVPASEPVLVRVRKSHSRVNDSRGAAARASRRLDSDDVIDAPFSRSVAEESAGLGIDDDALADLIARAQREIDEGHIPSCQIAFARHGKLVVWITFGDAPTDLALRHLLGDEAGRRVGGVDPDGRRRDRRDAARRRASCRSSRRTART